MDSHNIPTILSSPGRDFLVKNNGDQRYRRKLRRMANVDLDCKTHDLASILSSENREYLIRNDDTQVTISELKGKIVALYFSGSWCGPCRNFTPKLVEAYEELCPRDFEVVFVSSDRDEDSFSGYFSKMPWLSIPYSDLETHKSLKGLFKVRGIPHLVIIDSNGKVLSDNGDRLIKDFGAMAYPFTPERISLLREAEEETKRNQTLKSVLHSAQCDYVISNDGNQVPVSALEGKTVGLYFTTFTHKPCLEFTEKLVEVYNKIREKGDDFEIVRVSVDSKEENFELAFKCMPWLSLHFDDKRGEKLINYFELRSIPTLVIIGPDGKTLHPNVVDSIEKHGVTAYPFTPEKMAELESQTLESVLVSGELDYVIGKDGSKVLVSELVGKSILLYFSAQWCPPCRAFMPKLIDAYHEIKAKDDAFEVIYVSSDRDPVVFDDYFASMPWLAVPFIDKRKPLLKHRFGIKGIPALVALGPSGKTLTKEARQAVSAYGGDAYPFTEEHLEYLKQQLDETAKGWPEKLKHKLHDKHELVKIRRSGYTCDKCDEMGYAWSFYCDHCDFDLHPKCALNLAGPKDSDKENGDDVNDQWICDGDVCRKA